MTLVSFLQYNSITIHVGTDILHYIIHEHLISIVGKSHELYLTLIDI